MSDPIKLEGKLDLSAVTPLHTLLLEKAGEDIVLDMEDVTLFGGLCVQACIAAARSTRKNGNSFSMINTSDHVLGQINSMGLTPETIAEGQL